MTSVHATQIANLINERNQLGIEYSAEVILAHSADSLYEVFSDDAIACIEVKKVQWYQWELCHLSVQLGFERKGLGTQLAKRAEENAVQGGAKIIQCTIRENNAASIRVFEKRDFNRVSVFFNPISGNNVTVWQKIVSLPPTPAPKSD